MGNSKYRGEKASNELTLKKNGEPYAPTPTTDIRHHHYPMFRVYLAPHYLCLATSNQFAESNPKARQKSQRRNIWFGTKEPDALYAFGGIRRRWEGDRIKDRGECETKVYAFLTTEPNALEKPHDSKAVPAILQPKDYDSWLNDEWREAKKCRRRFALYTWRSLTNVKARSNQSLLEPLSYHERYAIEFG